MLIKGKNKNKAQSPAIPCVSKRDYKLFEGESEEDELHGLIKVLKNLRNVLDTRVLLMM